MQKKEEKFSKNERIRSMKLSKAYAKCSMIAPVSVYRKSTKTYVYDSSCEHEKELREALKIFGTCEILSIKMDCGAVKEENKITLTI